MNRDRTKEVEDDDEEVEAGREREGKREAWRERERIKASWVSISRVEASREDSLEVGGGLQATSVISASY